MSLIQTGYPYKYFITLVDNSTPSGSALFNGSPIYCLGADQTYALETLKGIKSIPLPLMPDFVGSNVGSVWNNMKGPTSFSGIQNPKVNITCNWSTDLLNTADDRILMTPYTALLCAASGRRFYLNDERITRAIQLDSNNGIYGSGMPVTIDSVQFRASGRDDKSLVSINIAMTEDRE